MEVAFILADAAQVSPDGKVHILGAGWRICGPAVGPHTVVALVSMAGHELGVDHTFTLDLVDEDGHPVVVETPQGQMTVRAEGTISGEGAPELPFAAPADVPFVVPIGGGLPLRPGSTYVWQLWLDGETRDDWRCSFYVRALPGA